MYVGSKLGTLCGCQQLVGVLRSTEVRAWCPNTQQMLCNSGGHRNWTEPLDWLDFKRFSPGEVGFSLATVHTLTVSQ